MTASDARGCLSVGVLTQWSSSPLLPLALSPLINYLLIGFFFHPFDTYVMYGMNKWVGME